MIDKLNADFVALDLSINKHGFPDSLPSLKIAEQIHDAFELSKLGYQCSMIVTSDGKTALATSGASSLEHYREAVQWNAEKFLAFLGDGQKQFQTIANASDKDAARKRIGKQVELEFYDSHKQVADELGKPLKLARPTAE